MSGETPSRGEDAPAVAPMDAAPELLVGADERSPAAE
jgi:hypothetical protein